MCWYGSVTQRVESSAPTTTRQLLASDRNAALDLLQYGLREVPVYRWLIGEDAPADAYRWYGEILFIEYLPGLRGAFDERGALIALIAVSAPTDEAGRIDDDLKERTKQIVQELDGFIHRFTELQRKSEEAQVAENPIKVIFALVHPEHRRGGTLAGLVDPVIERGRREGLPVTCSTSDEQLSALYARRWDAQVRAQFTLTDGPTVWVQRVDPPA
jgi:GNAT superfamily N-acetyltransferase